MLRYEVTLLLFFDIFIWRKELMRNSRRVGRFGTLTVAYAEVPLMSAGDDRHGALGLRPSAGRWASFESGAKTAGVQLDQW